MADTVLGERIYGTAEPVVERPWVASSVRAYGEAGGRSSEAARLESGRSRDGPQAHIGCFHPVVAMGFRVAPSLLRPG